MDWNSEGNGSLRGDRSNRSMDLTGVAIHPETSYATTSDGWNLAIHRWRGTASERRFPVLMLHGLGANRLNLHLTERYSIALAMARRGFDVYVAELRGAGLSKFVDGGDLSQCDWGFTDYATLDLPVIIEKVCGLAGATAVHGVGHSMGGMLLYAYGTTRSKNLRSICAVGSPLIGRLSLAFLEKNLLQLGALLAKEKGARRIPLKTLAGAAGYLGPLGNKFIEGMLINSENLDPQISIKVIYDATDNIPLTLVAELYQHFSSSDGLSSPYAYEARLDQIEVPVFALAGADDRVAVPASVAEAVSRLRSRDIRFRELGKRHGDRVDYGHLDLLVGLHAPREVYPLIGDFLEEVDLYS